MVQKMTENKDIMEVIGKMCEKKDDFVTVLENLMAHQTTMKNLIERYQEGDWVGFQEITKEMIDKYDTTGYGKKASFLMDVGGRVMSKEN